MARKSTILKVLIQNLSKGFTLIELIIGLLIFTIVGGLAMNALVESSKSFSQAKKNIDSSQNLSAILELIGNDIKQAGEQMNDGLFPVIVIQPNSDTGSMSGSSKITIRRALTSPLTLCESIAGTSAIGSNTIVVTDDAQGSISANCKPGTLVTTSVTRPAALMEARNYRCKLDNINADYSSTTTDFCLTTKATPDLEKVRAAMSDSAGNIRIFDYVDDSVVTANTKFNISIANLTASTPSTTTTYNVGSPIYLIEERIYTLDSSGNLQLQRDGGSAQTLISGISKFNVSARVYGDKTTKASDAIDPASTIANTTNVLPLARRCTPLVPYYICNFNSYVPAGSPAGTRPVSDDWKTLQGIKVELRAKYDPTGRNATPTDQDNAKLSATAEFFPRNVLSK